MSSPAARSAKARPRSGRPRRAEAGRIEARIIETARDLFFRDGYGAVSIETLAREARISKRTFYDRFEDKPAVFRAVVHRVIGAMRPDNMDALFKEGRLEDILEKVAEALLRVTLSKHLIALHRLLLAEAPRFPELAQMVYQEGTRQDALERITALLKREAKARAIKMDDPATTAEQFMMLVIAIPQRRAMGLGKPMREAELKDWVRRAVTLFLKGFYTAA